MSGHPSQCFKQQSEESPVPVAESMFKGTLIESLFFVLAGLMVFAMGALTQKQGPVSPLKSLVATEQAFSQAAADKGTREGLSALLPRMESCFFRSHPPATHAS